MSLLRIYKGRVATCLFCIDLHIKQLQNVAAAGLHKKIGNIKDSIIQNVDVIRVSGPYSG